MMLNKVYAPAWTSSNGFGQIRHKTKRGFLLTYTPIKALMQASYDAKLSLKLERKSRHRGSQGSEGLCHSIIR